MNWSAHGLDRACIGGAGSVAQLAEWGSVHMSANLERDIAHLDAPKPALLASASSEDAIRILLIEYDPLSRETLTEELSKRGINVQSFSDSAALLETLDGTVNAAVVIVGLNWSALKISQFDLLVELRQQGVRIPVVLMTGRARRPDEYRPLRGDASEVVRQIHDVDGLVDRLGTVIKALTSTTPFRSDKPLRYGRLLLYPDVNRACWNDLDLDLTVSEYKILELLASNMGRPITHRAIYDRRHYEGFVAGSGPAGYRANVRSIIKRIRSKFRSHDPAFDAIANIPGCGYRWGQEVTK